MALTVYILYAETHDRFYIGQTNNIRLRLQRHNNGYEKATKAYIPWSIKCVIEKSTSSEAMVLEKKLKNLNHIKLVEFH